MFTITFWKETTERALKTLAQTLVATIAVGIPLWDIDWLPTIGIALTATLLSVLTSIAGISLGEPGTPSLVRPGVSTARHAADTAPTVAGAPAPEVGETGA